MVVWRYVLFSAISRICIWAIKWISLLVWWLLFWMREVIITILLRDKIDLLLSWSWWRWRWWRWGGSSSVSNHSLLMMMMMTCILINLESNLLSRSNHNLRWISCILISAVIMAAWATTVLFRLWRRWYEVLRMMIMVMMVMVMRCWLNWSRSWAKYRANIIIIISWIFRAILVSKNVNLVLLTSFFS